MFCSHYSSEMFTFLFMN
ncbi:hypothetical protein F383_16597 [Gossypium arboreum]|uniref:Uncharacterized protein n=1 Tax=Gossypium arboreum TaxID=29729 RepID=A0A0B0NIG9_GOSAR|nr:hypothetical protein F383_16597 [Gossypium arboreum]